MGEKKKKKIWRECRWIKIEKRGEELKLWKGAMEISKPILFCLIAPQYIFVRTRILSFLLQFHTTP